MADPFLKWAGGKRWLADTIRTAYGLSEGRLVEPFLGSGAVFFAIEPREAALSDANDELMTTYRAVTRSVDEIIAGLERLPVEHETFHRLRTWRPRSDIDIAVRMIYLNRTAFNGLYRVNRRGEFNVPFGCKPETRPVYPETLRKSALALAGAELLGGDFRAILKGCRAGDFVYLDPPYTVRHNQNGFNRYNERLFSWDDQQDLASEAIRVAGLGATVFISNADHQSVRELYPAHQFETTQLSRVSRMAASPTYRGGTTEILIRSLSQDG